MVEHQEVVPQNKKVSGGETGLHLRSLLKGCPQMEKMILTKHIEANRGGRWLLERELFFKGAAMPYVVRKNRKGGYHVSYYSSADKVSNMKDHAENYRLFCQTVHYRLHGYFDIANGLCPNPSLATLWYLYNQRGTIVKNSLNDLNGDETDDHTITKQRCRRTPLPDLLMDPDEVYSIVSELCEALDKTATLVPESK